MKAKKVRYELVGGQGTYTTYAADYFEALKNYRYVPAKQAVVFGFNRMYEQKDPYHMELFLEYES